VNDKNLTPRLPKYSLIISVIIKTTGHSNTPAVRLNDRFDSPKKERLTGEKPSHFSSENILTPINSARSALAIKKEPRI
jgi:hypothetical protein